MMRKLVRHGFAFCGLIALALFSALMEAVARGLHLAYSTAGWVENGIDRLMRLAED